MIATHKKPKKNTFRQHILTKLNYGIRHQQPVEGISSEILQNVAQQLLMEKNVSKRKGRLSNFLKQIEEAKLIRKYHMVYESPIHNQQLSSALNYLTQEFKTRYSRYIS